MDAIEEMRRRIEAAEKEQPVISRYEQTALDMHWSRAVQEAELFERWATYLQPVVAGVVAAELVKPDPVTINGIYTVRTAIYSTFSDVFRALPGETMDKFRSLGSPRILQYLCGLSPSRMDESEWSLEVYRETHGINAKEAIDARRRPIREEATGLQWGSAVELAADLGCASVTVYKHMTGHLKSVKGRVFEYIPGVEANGPVPGSWASLTEEQKEADRQLAIRCGHQGLPR